MWLSTLITCPGLFAGTWRTYSETKYDRWPSKMITCPGAFAGTWRTYCIGFTLGWVWLLCRCFLVGVSWSVFLGRVSCSVTLYAWHAPAKEPEHVIISFVGNFNQNFNFNVDFNFNFNFNFNFKIHFDFNLTVTFWQLLKTFWNFFWKLFEDFLKIFWKCFWKLFENVLN